MWQPERIAEIAGAIWFAVVAVIGGVVAHIQQHELARTDLSVAGHMWAIVRRSVMGGFGGALVYFIWSGMQWPDSFGYFTAGIVGLFSSQAFEFMWQMVKGVARNKLGITENRRRGDDGH